MAAGKVRWYGSSVSDPAIVRAMAEGPHMVASEHELNVLRGELDALRVAEELRLASLNRTPPAMERWLARIAEVRAELTADGRSLVQGALGWIWGHSPATIPIPGFGTVAQVEENVGAAEHGPLPAERMERIRALLGAAQPVQAGTEIPASSSSTSRTSVAAIRSRATDGSEQRNTGASAASDGSRPCVPRTGDGSSGTTDIT